jgi:DNA-binding response OmpR family regulator
MVTVCPKIQSIMKDQPRVLVVEDHPDVLAAMTYLLHHTGCRVTPVQTGGEGLKRARETEFDLITLDIALPDISGFEVCRRLKENPRTEQTPVIFVSGRLDGENRQRGLDLGAADFIDKPFDASHFIERIFFHLEAARKSASANS